MAPARPGPIGVFQLRLVAGSNPPRYVGTLTVAGYPYAIEAHVETDPRGRYFAGRVSTAPPVQRETTR